MPNKYVTALQDSNQQTYIIKDNNALTANSQTITDINDKIDALKRRAFSATCSTPAADQTKVIIVNNSPSNWETGDRITIYFDYNCEGSNSNALVFQINGIEYDISINGVDNYQEPYPLIEGGGVLEIIYIGNNKWQVLNSQTVYYATLAQSANHIVDSGISWDSCDNDLQSKIIKNNLSLYYYGDSDITPTDESYFTYSTNLDGTVTITGYIGSLNNNIIIPYEIDGKLVTILGNGNQNIGLNTSSTITIPNSIQKINNHAFVNCNNLTNIIIPNSVTYLGKRAFQSCSSLNKIAIGHNVTTIENGAFQYCTSLSNITIPNNVIYIGNNAFEQCAFTNFIIPDSVTTILKETFKDCSNLTSITIGNGVTNISDYMFSGCSSLTSVTIPNSVTSVGGGAFASCSSLTSIEISDGVTTINKYAFDGCSSLTSVTIPNSVTSIGKAAFHNCNNLESMTLPFIGSSRAANETKEAVFGHLFDYSTTSSTGTIRQYYKSEHAYDYYIPSSLTTIILTDATQIPFGAFFGCSMLTNITISNNVTSINYKAFQGCSGLTNINIPNSVIYINNMAFYGCSSLTNVTIPNSVTSIGNGAFSGCSGLTSVTIGSGVTSIGDGVFRDCTSLARVDIPDSVMSIGTSAFSSCSELRTVFISNSVTNINDYTFSDCSSLVSVTIPNSVTRIGKEAFENCNNLIDVTIRDDFVSIGSGLMSIDAEAFANCTSLKTVKLNNPYIDIHPSAFSNCNNISLSKVLSQPIRIGTWIDGTPIWRVNINKTLFSTNITNGEYILTSTDLHLTNSSSLENIQLILNDNLRRYDAATGKNSLAVSIGDQLKINLGTEESTYNRLQGYIDFVINGMYINN